MDLTTVMVLCLTHLILQDFSSAESGDSEAATPSPEDTTNIPTRFTWAFSKYASNRPLGSERQDPVSDFSLDQVPEDYEDDDDAQARVVYWIPTPCDSLYERGYTCSGCGESLHCMAGNFGLRALCYGRRPYCKNGVCSFMPGEKCTQAIQTQIANQTIDQGVETQIANQTIDTHIANTEPINLAETLQANTTLAAL